MRHWKIVFAIVIFLFLILQTGADIVPQSNPQKEAGTIVSDLVAQPASTRTSNPVIFETNYGLANSGIADLTRGVLNGDQVCVLAGEFENDSRFSYSPGVSLIYMGTSPEKASIAAICDIGSIIADNQDYFQKYAGENAGLFSKARTDCGCASSNFNEKCCIVSVKEFTENLIQKEHKSRYEKSLGENLITFFYGSLSQNFLGIIGLLIAGLIIGFVFKKGTGFWRMLTIIFLLWWSILTALVGLIIFFTVLNFFFSFLSLIGYLLKKKFGLNALKGLVFVNTLMVTIILSLPFWFDLTGRSTGYLGLLFVPLLNPIGLTLFIFLPIVLPVIFLIKTKPLFDK